MPPNIDGEGDGEIDGSSVAEGDDEEMGGGASGRVKPNGGAEA